MNLVTDSSLLNDDHDGLRPMLTNEEQRNFADRRIPLTMVDIMYEFLGNMSGPIRKWYYDEDEQTLYIYHNDQGFSKKDEEAILQKNSSGDNSKTVGLNGHGFKVALDRVLSYDKRKLCTIYSINTNRKCNLGHFCYAAQGWEHCDVQNEVASILQKLEIDKHTGGSLFVIPFNGKYHEEYMKEKDMLEKKALIMLNIKIAENKVKFYWNNELQEIEKICPDEGCVTLDVDFGHDSKSEILNEKHKKTALMRINNWENLDDSIKTVLASQYIMFGSGRQKQYKPHKIEYKFRPTENVIMRLNTVSNERNILDEKDQDGILPYINNECIVHKPLITGLQGQHGFEERTYGGKPRFSIHITKKSKMYFIPTDKSNIKATTKGEYLHRFIHQFGNKYFTQRYNDDEIDNQSESYVDNQLVNDMDTQSENDVETQLVNDMDTQSKSYVVNQSENDVETQPESYVDIRNGAHEEARTVVNNELKQRTYKDNLPKVARQKDRNLQKRFKEQLYDYEKEPWRQYSADMDRCIICDRRIPDEQHQSEWHAGHILAHRVEGPPIESNCLAICVMCNKNDTYSSIPEYCINRYGRLHPTTIRVKKYMEIAKKDHIELFDNAIKNDENLQQPI